MIFFIEFAAVFACLDRLWGSDVKIFGRSGHSLATVGALVAAVVAYLTVSPYAAAMCALWAVYRSFNFSGGAQAPKDAEEALSAFARHLTATAMMGLVLLIQHQAFTPDLLVFLGYAGVATGLALINGATQGRNNWAIETIRGACFGACIPLALGFA